MSSDFLKGCVVGSAVFAGLMILSTPLLQYRWLAMCLEAIK